MAFHLLVANEYFLGIFVFIKRLRQFDTIDIIAQLLFIYFIRFVSSFHSNLSNLSHVILFPLCGILSKRHEFKMFRNDLHRIVEITYFKMI